jgi:hypothetical protein
MAGYQKPPFLAADPKVGAVSNLILPLVLGWVLGQLKWAHMLWIGLGIIALLLGLDLWRYFYAKAHPEQVPNAIDHAGPVSNQEAFRQMLGVPNPIVHVREIQLAGNHGRNDRFLTELQSIPGVEAQTRFLPSSRDTDPSLIKVWSAESIPDGELRGLAQATDAEIQSMTDDLASHH